MEITVRHPVRAYPSCRSRSGWSLRLVAGEGKMKKSEAHVAQGEFAKSQQTVGEKLEAPIQLTPEQLERVASGFSLQLGSEIPTTILTTATIGLYPTKVIPKLS
jgi:hypothetical protein